MSAVSRIIQRVVGRIRPQHRSQVATFLTPSDNRAGYLGDFHGQAEVQYAPIADDFADPGEVVWAWVPFEEDPSRGKDRPVVVVSRHADHVLLSLPLTSKDHDRDAAQERRAGRVWMDVGVGAWDARRRPSEVRLDRVLQLEAKHVRRVGATMERHVFEAVCLRLCHHHGWPEPQSTSRR